MLATGVLSFSQNELNRFCYPLEPLPVLEGFEDVLHLWGSKKLGAKLPAWESFTERDIKTFEGRFALSEREENDYRFRIYGPDFVKLREEDLTNQLLCASVDMKWKGGAYAYFSEISKGETIGRTHGSVPHFNAGLVELNSIDLPLSNNGIEVTHCLHVLG